MTVENTTFEGAKTGSRCGGATRCGPCAASETCTPSSARERGQVDRRQTIEAGKEPLAHDREPILRSWFVVFVRLTFFVRSLRGTGSELRNTSLKYRRSPT